MIKDLPRKVVAALELDAARHDGREPTWLEQPVRCWVCDRCGAEQPAGLGSVRPADGLRPLMMSMVLIRCEGSEEGWWRAHKLEDYMGPYEIKEQIAYCPKCIPEALTILSVYNRK